MSEEKLSDQELVEAAAKWLGMEYGDPFEWESNLWISPPDKKYSFIFDLHPRLERPDE